MTIVTASVNKLTSVAALCHEVTVVTASANDLTLVAVCCHEVTVVAGSVNEKLTMKLLVSRADACYCFCQ